MFPVSNSASFVPIWVQGGNSSRVQSQLNFSIHSYERTQVYCSFISFISYFLNLEFITFLKTCRILVEDQSRPFLFYDQKNANGVSVFYEASVLVIRFIWSIKFFFVLLSDFKFLFFWKDNFFASYRIKSPKFNIIAGLWGLFAFEAYTN